MTSEVDALDWGVELAHIWNDDDNECAAPPSLLAAVPVPQPVLPSSPAAPVAPVPAVETLPQAASLDVSLITTAVHHIVHATTQSDINMALLHHLPTAIQSNVGGGVDAGDGPMIMNLGGANAIVNDVFAFLHALGTEAAQASAGVLETIIAVMTAATGNDVGMLNIVVESYTVSSCG